MRQAAFFYLNLAGLIIDQKHEKTIFTVLCEITVAPFPEETGLILNETSQKYFLKTDKEISAFKKEWIKHLKKSFSLYFEIPL